VPNDSITLALHGDVSLDRFAEAIRRFAALVRALEQATGAKHITWEITDLEANSARATAVGVATNGAEAEDEVERVVRGFLVVGQSLERGAAIPFTPAVRREAKLLTHVLNGGVKAIRFETAEDEANVRAEIGQIQTPLPRPARGAVEGRIQTLSSRSGLRFTLYDTLHDRAVSCYLAEGSEDVMRNAWGRRAVVEGFVTRDPETDRPLAVRQVRNVELLPELPLNSFRALRGLAPSELSAEEAIRRLRDAG